MDEPWVVVEVGCLECEIETKVRGIYPTRDEALQHHPTAKVEPGEWGGQVRLVVLDDYQAQMLAVFIKKNLP